MSSYNTNVPPDIKYNYKIHVANLDSRVKESHMRRNFGVFGQIKWLKRWADDTATICYDCPTAVAECLARNQSNVAGRQIFVFCTERPETHGLPPPAASKQAFNQHQNAAPPAAPAPSEAKHTSPAKTERRKPVVEKKNHQSPQVRAQASANATVGVAGQGSVIEVNGVHESVTDERLKSLFSSFCPVVSLKRNKQTSSASIEVADPQSAEEYQNILTGFIFAGENLTVRVKVVGVKVHVDPTPKNSPVKAASKSPVKTAASPAAVPASDDIGVSGFDAAPAGDGMAEFDFGSLDMGGDLGGGDDGQFDASFGGGVDDNGDWSINADNGDNWGIADGADDQGAGGGDNWNFDDQQAMYEDNQEEYDGDEDGEDLGFDGLPEDDDQGGNDDEDGGHVDNWGIADGADDQEYDPADANMDMEYDPADANMDMDVDMGYDGAADDGFGAMGGDAWDLNDADGALDTNPDDMFGDADFGSMDMGGDLDFNAVDGLSGFDAGDDMSGFGELPEATTEDTGGFDFGDQQDMSMNMGDATSEPAGAEDNSYLSSLLGGNKTQAELAKSETKRTDNYGEVINTGFPDVVASGKAGTGKCKVNISPLDPSKLSSQQLANVFGVCGPIAKISLKDGATKGSITYEDAKSAQEAVAILNGFLLHGEALAVKLSKKL